MEKTSCHGDTPVPITKPNSSCITKGTKNPYITILIHEESIKTLVQHLVDQQIVSTGRHWSAEQGWEPLLQWFNTCNH